MNGFPVADVWVPEELKEGGNEYYVVDTPLTSYGDIQLISQPIERIGPFSDILMAIRASRARMKERNIGTKIIPEKLV